MVAKRDASDEEGVVRGWRFNTDVGFALERNHVHEVEGIRDVVVLFVPERYT